MPSRTTPILTAAAALLALGLLARAAPARADEPFGRLEVDEVERQLSAANFRVYDVNSRKVYDQAHVPGAIFAELSAIPAVLPADRTLRLVFYCKNTH